MGLRLRRDGERVKGDVTFDRRHEGAPGFAHGGAVATVLDDVLGTVVTLLGKIAVTAKLEVNFRHPTFLARALEAEGWLDRSEGRKHYLEAELRDGDQVVAEALAVYVQVDAEHFLQGARELPESWRDYKKHRDMKFPW